MKEESEQEKANKEKKWAKTEDPNPHTYKTEEAHERTSKMDKRNFQFKFTTGKRKTLFDDVQTQSLKRNVPSPDRYKPFDGERRIYKPCVRKR